VIESFTSAAGAVHVGGSTQLTAVFSGDSAGIDGIGPVESGVPVATPALARKTTFTLTVRCGPQQVEARLSIAATYRPMEPPADPAARLRRVDRDAPPERKGPRLRRRGRTGAPGIDRRQASRERASVRP
jgi:hypothetical protein